MKAKPSALLMRLLAPKVVKVDSCAPVRKIKVRIKKQRSDNVHRKIKVRFKR